ncbi:MAG TPA: serine/threonine-protein kinase [Kofleriaceae bacterium]|nr:serine/threonine-protein kinase [Kofleriaceae bacterium]
MTIPAGTLVPRDARDFGSYQLIAKLATGGMAEIFLARPTGAPERDVMVLKRILPHLAEDEHFVTMFRDEADLASKLIHKNVCHVHAFGEYAGTWFISMEYLHGVPLSRMMTRLSKAGKMLDFRVVAGIIVQACEGLHAAHEARGPDGQPMNVVHRDVSPPNMMVCADGLVKLLDFGIAKARGANSRTRTGTVKGKNAYMSPEQILGKPLDRRSDVFALAVVMYEMLAIRRLFHRDSDFLTFKAITEEPIPEIRERRPDLPPGMRAALLQAMARDPNGRFDTALAFGNAIRNSVATLGGPATPADLKRLLATDFADEMAARDEILKAADEPAPVAPPRVRPTQPPPIPVSAAAVPQAQSGELGSGARGRLGTGPITGPIEAVPSMIVQPGSARVTMSGSPIQTSPGALATMSTSPGSLPVLDLSNTMLPDSWMADPSTDLLRSHRLKSVRNAAIVVGALILVGVAAFLFAPRLGDSQPHAVAPAPVDAAVVAPPPPPPPVDAGGETRDEIKARSRYGFFSVTATAKTQIYIDNKLIGDTPLTQLPLPPGPHKIKAIGPRGKVKQFTTTIYGGQDDDEGTITW